MVKAAVQSSSPTTIPSGDLFWQPRNYGPPWDAVEVSRSSTYSFCGGDTPQQDVSVQAVRGYWMKTRPAGELAAAVSDTTSTTVTVSDSSVTGVGDTLIAGTEQMLVQDAAMADTGQTNTSGITTADSSDVTLGVTDGTKVHAGEILQIDSEWMLALSVTGNSVTVERAVSGTVLDTHSADTAVYALRSLTVERGFGGTTAASHSNADALTALLIPSEVREYAIAEALNYVFQKTTGYARSIGENNPKTVPGGSLPDLRAKVYQLYGRKARTRVV